MQTYFTNRQKTGLSEQIQGVHSVAQRVRVNFNDHEPWYTYIPIIGWFFNEDNSDIYEETSYYFTKTGNEAYSTD